MMKHLKGLFIMTGSKEVNESRSRFELSDKESAGVFVNKVLPDYWESIIPSSSPHIVIVSGQPGAGKSVAVDAIKKRYGTDVVFLEIDTDKLRLYHPKIKVIRSEDNVNMPYHTGVDADRWKEKLLKLGLDKRANILLEHTLRRKESIEKIVREFRAAAYGVELHCMAVDSKTSVQGVLLRYAKREIEKPHTGRPVEPSFHHESFAAYPANAQFFQDNKLVDYIAVYNRHDILFENFLKNDLWQKPGRVEDVINRERNRIWLPEEKEILHNEWQRYAPILEEKLDFPENYMKEVYTYSGEALLFLLSKQASSSHSAFSGVVTSVTPHHIFVVSNRNLVSFDKSPLKTVDLVDGDFWTQRPYKGRTPERKPVFVVCKT